MSDQDVAVSLALPFSLYVYPFLSASHSRPFLTSLVWCSWKYLCVV
jgi:hypothetical protein